jgi:hypothetical protein
MKVLTLIKNKLTSFKTNSEPKKILLTLKNWDTMVSEENLKGGFCTKHQIFLGPNNDYCYKCKSSEFVVTRQLPVLTIFDLPFEVNEKAKNDPDGVIII